MKLFISITSFFICCISFSQDLSDYAFRSGLEINGMAIKDNFLYFASYDNGYIRKIDLTQSPDQNSTLVVHGISGVQDLFFVGNDLYIAQFNGGKLKKIDVTLNNPTIETVVEGLGAPSSLALHNDYLYIAEAYAYRVSRINLSQTNPIPEIVVDFADGPFEIKIINDELYIAETYGGLISKINLNDPNATKETVINNISNPFCIGTIDDYLYYENNYIFNGTNHELFRIDITDISPIPVEFVLPYWIGTGLERGWIITDDNMLYKVYFGGSAWGGILKYDLSSFLSLDENIFEQKVNLYPNPASDYIKFNNLNKNAVLKISNNLGQIIFEKVVNGQEHVNIENLEAGMYLLSLDDLQTFKLIKE